MMYLQQTLIGIRQCLPVYPASTGAPQHMLFLSRYPSGVLYSPRCPVDRSPVENSVAEMKFDLLQTQENHRINVLEFA
jgi:hypothetical protein